MLLFISLVTICCVVEVWLYSFFIIIIYTLIIK